MLAQLELITALAEGENTRAFLRPALCSAAAPRAAQLLMGTRLPFVARGLLRASSGGSAATGCAYRIATGEVNSACCAATGLSTPYTCKSAAEYLPVRRFLRLARQTLF
jgi:hypothetical protein